MSFLYLVFIDVFLFVGFVKRLVTFFLGAYKYILLFIIIIIIIIIIKAQITHFSAKKKKKEEKRSFPKSSHFKEQ